MFTKLKQNWWKDPVELPAVGVLENGNKQTQV